MKKPGIPAIPKPDEPRARFDSALKESLESIMGRRGSPIRDLDPDTAVLADCVAKINEILETLQ